MEDNQKLYLRVVYDVRDQDIINQLPKNGIYVEFDPKEFKERLIENSKYPRDTAHAFDLTCDILKKQILKM
jgi:hypothetical protein